MNIKFAHACYVGVFAVALLGASSVQAAGPTIGVTFQEMNNPYFVSMLKAVQDVAKTLDSRLIVTDAHHDITKQTNDVQDMLQQHIDILVLNATDTVGIESAVIAAHNAGVVVVAVDGGAKGPVDTFVGSKNYDAGKLACTSLAKAVGGSGNVAILDGIPVIGILQRIKGCQDGLAAFPDVHVVARENGKQERATALTVTENMIQAHPDLKGIFSVNDGGAMGAYSAIQSSGKDIKLTSVDGAPEAIKAILEPNSKFVETSAQFPADMVKVALGLALAREWGATIPAELPIDVKAIDSTNAAGFHW